ncbi:MAG: two-component regulator propeller domain-containing protein, partial [Bacteroidales bacterium]
MIRRIIFTIQMIMVALISLYGQPDLRFENYYIEDGLPHSRTSTIFQDRTGWIWIGTAAGLSRFDGTSFKTFPLGNPSDEGSSSHIYCIWEDSDSMLWIGTENSGLVLYDRSMDRFRSFMHNDSSSNCISSNIVYSITSDSSGIMWIGTAGGLNRFDPDRNSFQWIQQNSSITPTLSSNTVQKVFIDRDSRLWLGTDRGLDYMNLNSNQITNCALDTERESAPEFSNRIEDICQDERGNILVATYYKGLMIIDPSLKRTTNIIPDPDYSRSYLIRSVFPDQNGNLWLGTRGGIYVLDHGYKVIAHHVNSLQDPTSLGHNSVHDIFKDNAGNIWIAHRSGVSNANLGNMAFKHYRAGAGDSRYLNDPEVYAICQSKDGKIWMGTESGGVNILDINSSRFTYLTHDEYNGNTLCSNCVKAIIQDNLGNFWIGTFLAGLDYYNVKQKRFVHYKNDPDDENSLINNTVWALHKDQNGNIWVGTDGGLDRFDPENRQFIHYRIGHLSLPVYTIYEDKAGNLFFGSSYGGLTVMKPDSKLTEFDIPARVIFEDSQGRVWIGSESNNGLTQFDILKGIVKSYKNADGLPSNQVFGILEDDHTKLWLSTGQGLSRFDPETEEFKTYKAEDGIQGDRFYYGSYCKCNSGELFFGGQNGLTRFDPDQLSENQRIPPVVITDFKIFNKQVPIGAEFEGKVILEKSISELNEIVVNHDQAVLTFDYVALNYVNSLKNEYAHILEGFEKEWNYDGSNRSATYTNLDPGSYVFRVKGSNNNGIWNETGTSLKIIVTPPFSQTLFFKFLILLLICFIAYLIVFFFLKREKLKNQLVLERVRSKELHKIDTMKFQFFTNISHEIRTPISLIISPLTRIRNSSLSKEQILKDIELVHRNALRLGKLVDQLLDYRKLEAGKLKLELSKGNIAAFLENILELFKEMSADKQVELKFFSTLDQIQIYFDPDKIEKVMFNLLSNSFKHTPAGGTISVSVSLSLQMNEDPENDKPGRSSEYVQIVVRDTGSGIEEGKREQIFERFYQGKASENSSGYGSGIGLSLSKELIKIHNGRILLKSQVGIGTEISVLFPVIKSDPNKKELPDA